MYDRKCIAFPNFGFLSVKLSEEELAPIIKEIQSIKNDFDHSEKYNKRLVGNIKKEFALKDSFKHIEGLVAPMVEAYENFFPGFIKQAYAVVPDRKLSETQQLVKLQSAWVNFQQKNEFNPVHEHTGLISFTIWIDVPYTIQDEFKELPDISDDMKKIGQFSFIYNDVLGKIRTMIVPCESSETGTMLVFPSGMSHCVYPFYSSDSYRVSVAGNVSCNIDLV